MVLSPLAVAAWVPITALVLSLLTLGGKLVSLFLYRPALSLAIDGPDDPGDPEPSRNHDYVQTPAMPRDGEELTRYVRVRVRNRRYLPAAENVQVLASFDPPATVPRRNGLDPRPLVWSSATTSSDEACTKLSIGPNVYRHVDLATTSGRWSEADPCLVDADAKVAVYPEPRRGAGHVLNDLPPVRARLLVTADNYNARRYVAELQVQSRPVEDSPVVPQRVLATISPVAMPWIDRLWARYDRARVRSGRPTFGVRQDAG